MLLPIAATLLQTAAVPAPPTQQEQMQAVMDSIYAAVSHAPGEQPDWDAYPRVFHPGATMVLPVGPGQLPKVQTVEEFTEFYKRVLATPGATDEGFVERCAGFEATVFGNVANVVSVYEARKTPDQELPDRVGIDCVQLMRTADGWTVVSLVTDYERRGNPLSEKLAAFTRPPAKEQAAKVSLIEKFDVLRASGERWESFLQLRNLHVGAYRLEAGATDNQPVHQEDEIYYVTAGKAQFTVDGKTMEVVEGDVLFVAAEAEHRYHDIKEDLQLLVFFARER